MRSIFSTRYLFARMRIEIQLWLFAVSVVASSLGGMLGMASGVFIVPILTLFAHLEISACL